MVHPSSQRYRYLPFQVDVRVILKTEVEQKKFAERDFLDHYDNWSSAAYDEVDWSKVQELRVRELLNEKARVAAICQSARCLKCPQFLKHVRYQV